MFVANLSHVLAPASHVFVPEHRLVVPLPVHMLVPVDPHWFLAVHVLVLPLVQELDVVDPM
jgi:hypothetical protein